MRFTWSLALIAAACTSSNATAPSPDIQVTFSGGYETNVVDGGRPVALVAGALGVPPEVFRYAFSLVTPAAAGQEPDPVQVGKNKAALLSVLGPYGITNDRLDAVSNYYRFNGSAGEVWPRTPAIAKAVVVDGVVTGFIVTQAGSGYSSPPTVTVSGATNVRAVATLSFGSAFATNGSLVGIAVIK